jgi:hypothetical protein
MERYLTDHGEVVAEIGRLAQMAAQRPSVQCTAARLHSCSGGCSYEQTR